MTAVYSRATGTPPIAAAAHGAQIWDSHGNRYLDGGSGALVVNIGHGNARVAEAVAAQLSRVGYVHATKFTTAALTEYTQTLAPLLPLDAPRVYPVSGGSEAVETALKMARAYHLARGEDRDLIVSRHGSYHGNSLGALTVSGRPGLRAPYRPWLRDTAFIPAANEYRCPFPDAHPNGCAEAHAHALTETIEAADHRVAAFIAEPIPGATLGGCLPPSGYWDLITEVCRRHGVLVIADEVLTGFGRTGTWFASDHFGLRPDIITCGKGAGSGYWPLAFAACSGDVHDGIESVGLTHGFTHSHHPAAAAAGLAVIETLQTDDLIRRAAVDGAEFGRALTATLTGHPHVGDVRGLGLLWGVELVADPSTKTAFPRSNRVIERLTAAARDRGLMIYSSTGCADGCDGDLAVLGPPLCTTETELAEIVTRFGDAMQTV